MSKRNGGNRGAREVHVIDFFRNGDQVARREEVVGLILWVEAKRRDNVWYKRWFRRLWLALPGVPKPEDPRMRVWNRDPVLYLNVMRQQVALERAAQEREKVKVKSP